MAVRLLLVMLFLSVAAAIAFRYVPPGWDPRVPLDLRAEPGLMAGWKMARIARRPEACFAAFAASRFTLARVPDRPSDVGCGVENAVLLPATVRTSPRNPTVTCRVAAAWLMLERHGLQQAARRHFGTEVAGVQHLGTYNCRNVNHATAGRRSQHATANAIDVAGFVLRDGREILVVRDWGTDTAAGAFLREVRNEACRWFNTVLGPAYNVAHANHFHLDMGPRRLCR
jgi:hypothetical protein